MTALRWRSIPVAGPCIEIAASETSGDIAWRSPKGMGWLPEPDGQPMTLDRAAKAVAVGPGYLGWLEEDGAYFVQQGADEPQRVPGTFSGVAFLEKRALLASSSDAPARLWRDGQNTPVPVRGASFSEIAGALAREGVKEAQVGALWLAAHAHLPEVERILGARAQPVGLRLYRAKGRLIAYDGELGQSEIRAPAGPATRGPDQVAVAVGDEVQVFQKGGERLVRFSAGGPIAFRPDGVLVSSAPQELVFWRLPGGPSGLSESAQACLLAHLGTFRLRCARPVHRTLGMSVALLARVWNAGIYPPLVWVHDLTTLFTPEGSVGPALGVEAEKTSQTYRETLTRVHEHPTTARIRAAGLGDAAISTVVARMLRRSPCLDLFEPPDGVEGEVLAGLQRPSEVPIDEEGLTPTGLADAWEAALGKVDLAELRAIDALRVDAVGLPVLEEGLFIDVLPKPLRPVLEAAMRILPVETAPQPPRAAALTGVEGIAALSRKGSPDNLIPTERAFPPEIMAARQILNEALYYGREAPNPLLQTHTWIVVDGSIEMQGDPLCLARAIALAARRIKNQRVYYAFFDDRLGPLNEIQRPEEVWRLLYGGGVGDPLRRSTTRVWEELQAQVHSGPFDVRVVVITHDLIGADESAEVTAALTAIAGATELRLVLIEFPTGEDTSLRPKVLPWMKLQRLGVPVHKVPVGLLWGRAN